MRERTANDLDRFGARNSFKSATRCAHPLITGLRQHHRQLDQLDELRHGVEPQQRKKPAIERIARRDVRGKRRLRKLEELHAFSWQRVGKSCDPAARTHARSFDGAIIESDQGAHTARATSASGDERGEPPRIA